MNITIKRELNDVNWEELSTVFERVQWGRRDPEALRRAYHKSFAVCFAYDDDRLVGTARAISDGEYYAGIYDAVVLPEYQSQGIGKQLMTALLEKLPVGNIILLAVQGKEGFYEKLGFAKLKTGLGRFSNMEGMRKMGYIE